MWIAKLYETSYIEHVFLLTLVSRPVAINSFTHSLFILVHMCLVWILYCMCIAEIEDWTEEQNREKVKKYTFHAHTNSYMNGNMLRYIFNRTLHVTLDVAFAKQTYTFIYTT